MTQVTANPVAMQEFVTGMGTAKGTLADAQTTEAATVRAFLNEGSTGITGGYEIVGAAMNALIHELVEIKDWVKVVRDAAIEADVGAQRRQHRQRRRAQRRAQPHRCRAGDRPPGAGGVEHRHAAGHVGDPGAPGLRVRQRPGVHGHRSPARRRHRLRHAGPPRRAVVPAPVRLAGHGRRRVRAGLVVVGRRPRRHQRRRRVRAGRSRRPPRHVRARRRRWVPHARRTSTSTPRSTAMPSAPLGSPVAVLRADLGLPSAGCCARSSGRSSGRPRSTTTAGRASSGSTTTAGGRCELVWVGRTVAGLRASDGRQARFRYDRRGHLVEVRNAVSPETYDVDEQGRIRSITDADGVRMVAMTYDDDGRVVAQISQTGLTTRFGYTAGLRTTLSDAVAHPDLGVHARRAGPRRDVRHGRRAALQPPLRRVRAGRRAARTRRHVGVDDRAHRGHGCASSSSRRRPVRWSGSRSTPSTASCTTPPSRAPRPPRARASSTTATRSTPGASRSTASSGWPSTWPGSTACRRASSTATASPTSSRSPPTAPSPAYRNALGDITGFEYSPAGAIAARYLPDGRVVGYERDDAGRLLAMVNPAGERGELTYTPAGRLLSTRDYDGAAITLEYDGAGLPHRVVAPDGAATDFVFDDEQRVVGVRFANGDTIGFERDEFGRETAVDVDGSRWTIDRDQAGRVVKLTDPAGVEAEAEHDPLGQWMSIADSTGQRWQLERGLIDRVRRLRTPTGEHEATYTAEGLLASTSSSDGTDPGHPLHRGRARRLDRRGRAVDRVPLRPRRADVRCQQRHRLVAVRARRQRAHGAAGVARRARAALRLRRARQPGVDHGGRRTRGRSSTTPGAGSARSPIRPGAPRRSPTTSGAGWSPRRTPAGCRCATPTTAADASPNCSMPPAGRCRTSTTPSTS